MWSFCDFSVRRFFSFPKAQILSEVFRAVNHNWLNIKFALNWRWWMKYFKLKTSLLLSFLLHNWYEIKASNSTGIRIMWIWTWNSASSSFFFPFSRKQSRPQHGFYVPSGRNLQPPRITLLFSDAGQVTEIFMLLMRSSQTAQLYLREPEMRDDLLHMWKSITLTDTPLILY